MDFCPRALREVFFLASVQFQGIALPILVAIGAANNPLLLTAVYLQKLKAVEVELLASSQHLLLCTLCSSLVLEQNVCKFLFRESCFGQAMQVRHGNG
jgi:hypothetical protein